MQIGFACPLCNQCFMKWSACQLHLGSVHGAAKPHDLKESCKKHSEGLPSFQVTVIDESGDKLELQNARSVAEVKQFIIQRWQMSLELKRLVIGDQLCHDGDSLVPYVVSGEPDSRLVVNLVALGTGDFHEGGEPLPPVVSQTASDRFGDGTGSDRSSEMAGAPIVHGSDCDRCTSSAASTADSADLCGTSSPHRNWDYLAVLGETRGTLVHPECCVPCKWHFKHAGFCSESEPGSERPAPCNQGVDCMYCHHEDHLHERVGLFRKGRSRGRKTKSALRS
eukprot:TRINITY_DN110236_c0_g1_i1.p1 TRINITY_DN110236_c0_g1~~TRINITY_DN110236_c0_g1_i1.p1  ORF type:complete len:280 (+),score=13.14 TRINITY_DN110236_c0_g1_i1:89-928(+)